jgi:hypothetical protein
VLATEIIASRVRIVPYDLSAADRIEAERV